MSNVESFNSSVPSGYLTEGFEKIAVAEVKYDPYDMQDVWEKVYPDFYGYNCRITAFSPLEDTVKIETKIDKDDAFLFMDFEALY